MLIANLRNKYNKIDIPDLNSNFRSAGWDAYSQKYEDRALQTKNKMLSINVCLNRCHLLFNLIILFNFFSSLIRYSILNFRINYKALVFIICLNIQFTTIRVSNWNSFPQLRGIARYCAQLCGVVHYMISGSDWSRDKKVQRFNIKSRISDIF